MESRARCHAKPSVPGIDSSPGAKPIDRFVRQPLRARRSPLPNGPDPGMPHGCERDGYYCRFLQALSGSGGSVLLHFERVRNKSRDECFVETSLRCFTALLLFYKNGGCPLICYHKTPTDRSEPGCKYKNTGFYTRPMFLNHMEPPSTSELHRSIEFTLEATKCTRFY